MGKRRAFAHIMVTGTDVNLWYRLAEVQTERIREM